MLGAAGHAVVAAEELGPDAVATYDVDLQSPFRAFGTIVRELADIGINSHEFLVQSPRGGELAIQLPTSPPNTPAIPGYLPRVEIEAVVRANADAIRQCYEDAAYSDRSLAGRVIANWTIGLKGEVLRVSLAESFGPPVFGDCIMDEIQSWQFPAPDGGMCVIVFPFTFRLAEKTSANKQSGDEPTTNPPNTGGAPGEATCVPRLAVTIGAQTLHISDLNRCDVTRSFFVENSDGSCGESAVFMDSRATGWLCRNDDGTHAWARLRELATEFLNLPEVVAALGEYDSTVSFLPADDTEFGTVAEGIVAMTTGFDDDGPRTCAQGECASLFDYWSLLIRSIE